MLAVTFMLLCLAMATSGITQVAFGVVTLVSLGLTFVNALHIR